MRAIPHLCFAKTRFGDLRTEITLLRLVENSVIQNPITNVNRGTSYGHKAVSGMSAGRIAPATAYGIIAILIRQRRVRSDDATRRLPEFE